MTVPNCRPQLPEFHCLPVLDTTVVLSDFPSASLMLRPTCCRNWGCFRWTRRALFHIYTRLISSYIILLPFSGCLWTSPKRDFRTAKELRNAKVIMVQKGLTRMNASALRGAWRSGLEVISWQPWRPLVAPWRRNGSSDLDQMPKGSYRDTGSTLDVCNAHHYKTKGGVI